MCLPFMFTSSKWPRSSRRIVTFVIVLIERWFNVFCLISRVGFHVDCAIILLSDRFIVRNLFIMLSMFFILAFMLLMWRSVEIEFGRNPCLIVGIAIR